MPLQSDVPWDNALGKAEWLGEKAWGGVRISKGWGIRVKAAEREEALKLLRPEDWQGLSGTKYPIAGLPLSRGSDSVQAALDGWSFTPLFNVPQKWTRAWVVRAAAKPVIWKFQHDFGLGLISVWEDDRKQHRECPVQVFRRNTTKAVSSPALPAAWAAVVTSGKSPVVPRAPGPPPEKCRWALRHP